jgi:hypothetical protein
VQTFPSSQLTVAVATHAPAWQWSPLVQAFASVHVFALLFACVQPVDAPHASSVQGLLSLQFGAAPPVQVPALHLSFVVHALPSLQAARLLMCRQPPAVSQESSVHTLPSSQLTLPAPAHFPPEQTSPRVHASLSLHDAALLACAHPVAGLHESSVHTLLSLQLTAEPLTQAPAAHVSPVVQALPSSQVAVLFACAHPVAGLQESFVQGLLSLQFGAAPPTHAPPAQVSPVVQAFPSLQATVLFAWAQPVAGTHESLVHGLLSLQFGAAPPTHAPPEHVSPVVHALPSLQDAVLFECAQPVAGLHESSVHALPSLQFVAEPPTQAPPAQASPVVHALPSLHAAVLFA